MNVYRVGLIISYNTYLFFHCIDKPEVLHSYGVFQIKFNREMFSYKGELHIAV